MSNRLYVGGLPWATTKEDLIELFEENCGKGSVIEVNIIKDKETQRSRGFAFVEMNSKDNATLAINKINGIKYTPHAEEKGRELQVAAAQDRNPRSNSGRGSSSFNRYDRNDRNRRDESY